MTVEFEQFMGDHGSVWTFQVRDLETDALYMIGVDHRPAFAILEAMSEGELVHGEIEDWQILAHVTPVK